MKIDTNLFLKQHIIEIADINECLGAETIESIARQTKFLKRKGKLPASCFVNSLIFNENSQANTSLQDLTADLVQAHDVDISKEALHKRFTVEAVDFLKAVLANLLTKQLQNRTKEMLPTNFGRIKIKDSTKFALPDCYGDNYKGYGNFSKKNGLMSLQYEYDLYNNNWLSIEITKGLRNDQQDSKETTDAISEGDLHIRDLGYITPTYLSAIVSKKAYFLNRLPSKAAVLNDKKQILNWEKLNNVFNKHNLTAMEFDVLVYEKDQIPCRLIIERIADEEYTRRLQKVNSIAKSKGIGVSALHKIKLRYNFFITNVDASILPFNVIRKTYYLRWQIELVFKTWKSNFRIDKLKKVKKERLECQMLARLMWILINWRLYKTFNRHAKKINNEQGVSVLRFFKRSLKFAATLRLVLLNKFSADIWLKEIYKPLVIDCLCMPPHKQCTHYEYLKINMKA